MFEPRCRHGGIGGALLAACALIGGPAAAQQPSPGPPGEAELLFERDVLPILTAHCLKCHGLEAAQAGLDLRTVGLMVRGGDSGAALVPGSLEESLVWSRLSDRSMPPEGELPLDERKIDTISRWIAAGARAASAESDALAEVSPVSEEDRGYWAFQPLRRPPVPPAPEASTPVDAFVAARLAEHGLELAAQADPATLIRRAHLDLLGLPPDVHQVDSFVAECSSPEGAQMAWQRLLDRLLASPHYGEHWGRHWLDAAGYADTVGSDNDAAIIKVGEQKWLYRDYVVQSLNDDKPYDRFLAEQLAGDELVDWRNADQLTPRMRELLVATGYLRSAIDDTDQKELNTALIRYRVLHLSIEIMGTGLLGLTTGCARCHSHKFDPIPQRDYYRLMALLTPAYNPQSWVAMNERFLPDVSPAEQRRIEEHNAGLDRQIEPLAAQVATIEAAERERLSEAKLATLPEPIRADTKAALATPAEERSEVQNYLAGKFESLLAVTPEEVKAALSAADQQTIAGLNGQIEQWRARRRSWGKLHALYDTGPPPATFLLRRGNHETPGPEVEPGFLTVLCDGDGKLPGDHSAGATSGRRLAFARWLTDGDSRAGALVARVMVNRIWQHLFGQGIVATSENFGRQGTPPTHPELLEWLAAEFVEGGWQIKPLVRMLMASAVYRQSSAQRLAGATAAAEAADPSNQLLWRMRLRRLDSETVRDCILAAAGRLDRSLGGPPLALENRPDGMVVIDQKSLPSPSSAWRRSLYLLARRNYHLSFLSDFDQPAVATNCTRRSPSAVVLQSLTMMNGAFVLDQAEAFARRVASAASTPQAQVDMAFRVALCRPPKPEEIEWSRQLLDQHVERYTAEGMSSEEAAGKALAHLCQMLLNTNEFLYVH